MSSGNRKPIIIAAVCIALTIVVFALGAGFGGRDAKGAADWQDRFTTVFEFSSELSAAELRPSGGDCSVENERITTNNFCTLTIAEFGGPFSLQATKQVQLVPAAPVEFILTVEGTTTRQEAAPECQIDAVFGRSGGTLTLRCLNPTAPCAVDLRHGKDCS